MESLRLQKTYWPGRLKIWKRNGHSLNIKKFKRIQINLRKDIQKSKFGIWALSSRWIPDWFGIEWFKRIWKLRIILINTKFKYRLNLTINSGIVNYKCIIDFIG
jgi:hypothetical protein